MQQTFRIRREQSCHNFGIVEPWLARLADKSLEESDLDPRPLRACIPGRMLDFAFGGNKYRITFVKVQSATG